MNITGSLELTLRADEALANGLESGSLELNEPVILNYLSGTAAGQCDRKWSKSSTLAAGASETWVLSALTDGLGRTASFARVKILLIENPATVDGDDLSVGGASTHPVTSIQDFKVKSMGVEAKGGLNTTGYVITSGSADQLKVTNSGANPITYRIVLIGCST